ncbi:hypothetical protein BP5796_07922 [Coleophoma crateriformis]|uniref:Uncharacterized protein n=1 Tax=Coleophoma crateriformis TaxID=565419 RepID=A0A3D8RD88_9HELO|nr:hypothetical protein BP5796_07922 [Coleophoma crateriformis]
MRGGEDGGRKTPLKNPAVTGPTGVRAIKNKQNWCSDVVQLKLWTVDESEHDRYGDFHRTIFCALLSLPPVHPSLWLWALIVFRAVGSMDQSKTDSSNLTARLAHHTSPILITATAQISTTGRDGNPTLLAS